MIRTIARQWVVACSLRHSPRLRNIATKPTAVALTTPDKIIEQCIALRSSIQKLNDKFKGPLDTSSQKNTILPFVFLLGNHSSGKSSFINYVCQRRVQTAGVAPTDDSFSIIVPGPSDEDRSGPAFIADPDMGFSGLQAFGPQLKNHTQLKVRSDIAIKNFMIVDTPGMIDSPKMKDGRGQATDPIMDRGYDFEAVCKWYAERADVILLFFDPDKPGTTGETLQILTNSLLGLDHKLHIILNKADQFKKIHDFARAYGALCWNLSKVIQRKDLPRIYTMCLPKSYQAKSSGDEAQDDAGASSGLARALTDLEDAREDVVREVLNAPKRRIDNEINRLTDAVAMLQMHLSIVDDLLKTYRAQSFWSKVYVATTALGTVGVTGGMVVLGLPLHITAGGLLLGSAATGALGYFQVNFLEQKAMTLVTEESLDATFRRLFARRIADRDEFINALWRRIRYHLVLTLTARELTTLERVNQTDLQLLQRLLDNDIPDLRRSSAPEFNKSGAWW